MAEPTVFCYECKHLLGKRHNYDTAQNWKCAAPANVLRIEKDAVTGTSIYSYRHESCYEARKDHAEAIPGPEDFAQRDGFAYKVDKFRNQIIRACGIAGQWYEKYEPYQEPRGSNPLASRKPQAPSADALLAELETPSK